jgi:FlaA1/EpsC-like NDP-sugar epimerase
VGWECAIEESTKLQQPGMTALRVTLKRAFPLVQYAVDAGAWIVAVPVTTVMRYDMQVRLVNKSGVIATTMVAVLLQGAFGLMLGLYRRRYRYASFEEFRALGYCVGLVGVAMFILAGPFGGSLVPRSVPVLAAFLALVLACVGRYLARLLEERHLGPPLDGTQPLVVFGAGRAGAEITRTLLHTKDSPYRPVALVDDDPAKARMQINGLRVRGTGDHALEIAAHYGANSVLIAIPQITGERLRVFAAPLLEAGRRVLVLPPVAQMLGDLRPSHIRPITVADLLGRHPADVDMTAVAGYITARRVLVTGAGGSIGSELCRQLHAFRPASLVMLDRDESGLHGTQLELEGRALLDSPSLVLADVRDRPRVFEVFREHRPEVIFHAASLKHLPLLEFNPTEAWKTNVVGTHHVLEAAEASGVSRLVNVSTNMAADPTNVLGFSKRICERLTAEVACRTGLPYVSVRFGNVLGTKGSVLGVFERQVRDGGPITVTHPDVTRYLMTPEESVALTIQAGAIGGPGEVLVLDMGEPVRIVEVANRLAERSPSPIEIVFTGLRPGEKLHEERLGSGEPDVRPNHPLISQVPVPPMSFDDAQAACSVDGRRVLSVTSLEVAALWGIGEPRASRSAETMAAQDPHAEP